MSFRCDGCHTPQDPGTRPTRVTTAVRPKRYYLGDRDPVDGVEIQAEQSLCVPCAATVTPIAARLVPELKRVIAPRLGDGIWTPLNRVVA